MDPYANIPVYLRRKRAPEVLTAQDKRMMAVVLGVCVLATVIYFLVPTVSSVHADEPPVVHDNAYYCKHLSHYTNGADPKFADFCKQYE